MLNVQKIDKIEFDKIMKRRRIRTYTAIALVVVSLIYIIVVESYQYAIRKSYCKYLINMDAGNYDIEKLKERRIKYESEIDIHDVDYEFNESIEKRNSPKSVIIHHTAADNLTPEMINEDHKHKGYGGIGYHFYIRTDGTVYRGRPEEYAGAHTIGRNFDSIGICLEGNFENDTITEEEEKALVMLSTDMIIKYNIADIIGHKDAYQTLCPGKNISLEDIRGKVEDEIVKISK